MSPNSSESEKNVDINVCIKLKYVSLLFNLSISKYIYVFSEIMLQMQKKIDSEHEYARMDNSYFPADKYILMVEVLC